MSERSLIRVLNILLFVIVIGTPLFFIGKSVYPYTFTKTLFFQAAVELLFFLWVALAISKPTYRPKRTPIMIALLMFGAALLVTNVFAIDPWRSFWSTQERALGVFTLLHFVALAVVVSSLWNEVRWKWLWYASLGTSAFVGGMAFIQLSVPNLLLIETVGDRPGATFGNPTFFAGYLVFHIFIALYFLLSAFVMASKEQAEKQSSWKWKGLLPSLALARRGGRLTPRNDGRKVELPRHSVPPPASSREASRAGRNDGERRGRGVIGAGLRSSNVAELIFLAFVFLFDVAILFITKTRGDILGLGAGIATLVLLFAFRPPVFAVPFFRKRSLYAALLGCLVLFGGVFWFTRTNSVWTHVPGLNRFRDVSFQNAELQPRFIALTAAWRGFKDRPLVGWGWDNFNIVFNRYYDPRALEANYQETRFDKPHNVFLEYLTVGGVLLTAAFLFLIAACVNTFRRLRDTLFAHIAGATLVAYLVRSVFVFDTLGPLLMLYLLIGYADGGVREQNSAADLRHAEKKNGRRISGALVFAMALVALIPMYTVNVLTAEAAYRQFYGFQHFVNGRVEKAIASFKEAIGTWSPYRWNLERDYATAVSEAYFHNPDRVTKEEALLAVAAMEDVVREHPEDAYNHYAILDMYNQVSDIDPERFHAAAEREAAIALRLTPDRQEVYFSLAKTKTLKKEYAEALALLDKALALNPNVADAHFYYGLVSYAAGDTDRGYREIKIALELGRAWKNSDEPRVVGNYFAEYGHLAEAIALYEQALVMNSDDIEARLKLGVAYYRASNTARAREVLTEVVRQTDLRESPSYPVLRGLLNELGVPH